MALTACASGPDFQAPAAPAVRSAEHPYTEAPLPATTASAPGRLGDAQQFALGKDVPALWWEVFHSEPLDALIRSALEHSPTLASAQAALRQAQAQFEATSGNQTLPAVTGQAGVTRERSSQASSGAPGGAVFNLFNASVNVSYSIDAFGATRRELESLQASADYQRFQVDATYLTLTANLVTSAIQEASLRAQLEATQAVIGVQERSLALVQRQADLGAVALSSVLTQQTQLAQTRATLPALQKSLEQTRQQLAVYAGRLPGEGDLPAFTLDSLQLPASLPVSLPSALVRQRPDIQASEALLHSASAQVGVATANLYPQFTLSGSAGLQSLKLGNLFDSSSQAWSLGGSLLAPIFNGGALQAQRRAAVAAFDQARANYQQTVLNAFLNVASTLSALDHDARALRAQSDAARLAQQSLDLTNRQLQAGAVSSLSLYVAQATYQQTRIALVQAQAARLADTAALFQAMGGGWWNRTDLAQAEMSPQRSPQPPLAFSTDPSASVPPPMPARP